jgi:hypothetical protein
MKAIWGSKIIEEDNPKQNKNMNVNKLVLNCKKFVNM